LEEVSLLGGATLSQAKALQWDGEGNGVDRRSGSGMASLLTASVMLAARLLSADGSSPWSFASEVFSSR